MIKKIGIAELRPGMFVADFNAGWLDHPFLRNSLLITRDEEVRQVVASGIRELFIDTERGLDVGSAPTREQSAAETERQLQGLAEPRAPERNARRVSRQEEFAHARATFREATRLVKNLMDDARLGHHLEFDVLHPLVHRITESVIRNPSALMTMRVLKSRDDYTFRHSVSVCTILASFARSLGVGGDELHEIALGGLIHDVGKVSVALEILNKPGKLDDAEFSLMKTHVDAGLALVGELDDVSALAKEVLAFHHERFDGSGYPRGCQGEAISRVGRMAAIVDVYDAITSDRVYHKAICPALAMQKLFEWGKFHFDPELVRAFVRSVGIYPVGTLVRLESGRLAVVIDQREGKLLQPLVRVVFDCRHDHPLAPQDLDLARPLGAGGGDRIVGYEASERWPIDISRVLQDA